MNPLSARATARRAGDRVAIVDGDGSVSWRELAAQVAREAEALVRDASRPARWVGRPDRATVVRVLAALEAGVDLAMLHPRWTAGERERAERTLEGWTPAAGGARLLVFTSGSTGHPRAAILPARALAAAADASAANLPLAADDRWLLCLPPAHVGGLMVAVRAVRAGCAIVLADRFDAAAAASLGVTIASLVPTQLARWLAEEPAPIPTLRALLLGGAGTPPALLARAAAAGIPVLATYGLTEACSQVATWRPGIDGGPEAGSGVPLPGVEVAVVDGRIRVRGATLFEGYAGKSSPFTADGWFDTGDLGRLDGEGRLHVAGRADDVIVTGGENVHPLEIEAVLAECPAVEAVAVFGEPDPTWGERVCAAVVSRAEPGPGAASGRALAEMVGTFAAARLASFKRPRRIVLLQALPRTGPGKIDRAALRRLAGSGG